MAQVVAPATQVEESMVQRYLAIPPLLRSIEDLLYGTNSGKAPAMAHYYAHWEHLVFGAIHTAVLRGLRRLQELLNPRAPAGERPRGDLPPLFQVGGCWAACWNRIVSE